MKNFLRLVLLSTALLTLSACYYGRSQPTYVSPPGWGEQTEVLINRAAGNIYQVPSEFSKEDDCYLGYDADLDTFENPYRSTWSKRKNYSVSCDKDARYDDLYRY